MRLIDLSRMITAEDARALALDAARAEARARLTDALEALADQAAGAVPLAEKLSWAGKEAAARALLAGVATPAQTRMIAAEAEVAGEAAADLARRILGKAGAWRARVARLTGLRRQAEAAIALAATPAEVADILAGLPARARDGEEAAG